VVSYSKYKQKGESAIIRTKPPLPPPNLPLGFPKTLSFGVYM